MQRCMGSRDMGRDGDRDAKRHVLGSRRSGTGREHGADDRHSNIQYMAERALDAQMAKVKARHGTVVVQDPNTGQIGVGGEPAIQSERPAPYGCGCADEPCGERRV